VLAALACFRQQELAHELRHRHNRRSALSLHSQRHSRTSVLEPHNPSHNPSLHSLLHSPSCNRICERHNHCRTSIRSHDHSCLSSTCCRQTSDRASTDGSSGWFGSSSCHSLCHSHTKEQQHRNHKREQHRNRSWVLHRTWEPELRTSLHNQRLHHTSVQELHNQRPHRTSVQELHNQRHNHIWRELHSHCRTRICERHSRCRIHIVLRNRNHCCSRNH
jgi:hypothetical protein